MIWGFRKRTLRQRRLAKRKKYIQQQIAKLTHKKAILELEIEELNAELFKQHEDLKHIIKREGQDG